MELPNKTAIVRHVRTNDLYSYNGDNNYTNLRTQVSGVIDEEIARKSFVINVEMTVMIAEYPVVSDLIKQLQLKIDKQ